MKKLKRAGHEGQVVNQYYNYLWELWWWDGSHSHLFRRPLKKPHDSLQDDENWLASGKQNGRWAVLEGNFIFLVSNDPRGRFRVSQTSVEFWSDLPSKKANKSLLGATSTYDTHSYRLVSCQAVD